MANRTYPLAGHHFGEGDFVWASNNFKLIALKSTYTYSDTHEFVTDLGANIVGRSANLSSKSSTSGYLKSANALFTALTGSTVTSFALVKDTGSDATSLLIRFIDTANVIPSTPNGIDWEVQPDPTYGWLRLR